MLVIRKGCGKSAFSHQLVAAVAPIGAHRRVAPRGPDGQAPLSAPQRVAHVAVLPRPSRASARRVNSRRRVGVAARPSRRRRRTVWPLWNAASHLTQRETVPGLRVSARRTSCRRRGGRGHACEEVCEARALDAWLDRCRWDARQLAQRLVPTENAQFGQLFLYLTRACLGKTITVSIKRLERNAFFAPQ